MFCPHKLYSKGHPTETPPRNHKTPIMPLSHDFEVPPASRYSVDELGLFNAVTHAIWAEDPNTPIPTLAALALHEDHGVRCRVARNPNTPLLILLRLVTDVESYVREAVLESKRLDPAMLYELGGDDHEWTYLATGATAPAA